MNKKLILGLLIICICIIISQDVKGGTVGTSTQLQPALLQGPPDGWNTYTQPITGTVIIDDTTPIATSFTTAQGVYHTTDPDSTWTLVRSFTDADGSWSSDAAAMAPVDLNGYISALVLIELTQSTGTMTSASIDIAPVFLRSEITAAYNSMLHPTGATITITGSTVFKMEGGFWGWLGLTRGVFTSTVTTAAAINIYFKGQ